MTLLWLDYPAWLAPSVSASVPLRWYGILISVSLLGIWFLFSHEACRRRLRPPTATGRQDQARFFLWVLLSSLFSARVLHVASTPELQRYLQAPWMLVWPFEAGTYTGIEGMSMPGALAGALVGAAVFSAITKKAVLRWADVGACCAPLVTVGAGLGNFANGEQIGRLTDAPWGVRFPNGERLPAAEARVGRLIDELAIAVHPEELLVNLPRHPSQLYTALLAGLFLWAVLWFLVRPLRLFPGALLAMALTGYGVLSFFTGYYREADVVMSFTRGAGTDVRFVDTALIVSRYQVVSLAIAVLGVFTLVIARLIYRPEPTVATYEERHTE